MELTVQRNDLFTALQSVISVVERKQTMPVLSCFLVEARDDHLVITATDLELELITYCNASIKTPGIVAIPARKLFDICRGLSDGTQITIDFHKEQIRIRSGRARFMLSWMAIDNWPNVQDFASDNGFEIQESALKTLLEKTEFAMAHQDVRYYLNGLLIVLRSDLIRCVATDGHRLALSQIEVSLALEQATQAIVPRKAVMELTKLLDNNSDTDVAIQLSRNHMRIELPGFKFTTKLIDGRFPDYDRVIPDANDKRVVANREAVRQSLSRAAILSNEQFGGVRLSLNEGLMTIQSNNSDREEAEDEIEVNYSDEPLEIGFNVRYLLDAIAVMTSDEFTLDLANANTSGLLQEKDRIDSRYVVMPMRL